MAGLERNRFAAWPGLLALTATLVFTGCASRGKPPASGNSGELVPPQTLVAPPTSQGTPPEPAQPPPAAAPPEKTVDPDAKDPTVVLIDSAPAPETAQPQTLAQAAANERQRRSEATGVTPKVVITDKNLARYAAGGVLTIAKPDNKTGADATATADEAKKASEKEAYWRHRGLEIRQKWHDAVENVKVLQAKANELRQQFYSTDDPAVRDGQIKPEWDRTLADLEQAKYDAAQGPSQVEAFLEEGRRAGALPGWLREGVDLEPEPVLETVEDAGEPGVVEPMEPKVYQQAPPTQDSSEEPPPGSLP